MAQYPDIVQSWGSTKKPFDSTTLDQAGDGTIRGTIGYSLQTFDFVIIHDFVTEIQRDEILNFYANNRQIEFTFGYYGDSDPATNYDCIFQGLPVDERATPDTWKVTMKCRGSRTP